jgi:endonuclease/exonuclease/phosphatase family metal-dependent hydrolase
MKPALSLILLFATVSSLWGERFMVVAYNVENLFDADGVARYEDYQPPAYHREHLLTKLTNITALMQRFNRGRGPDVILFQEIEADQTPEKWDGDLVAFLTKYTGSSVRELLREKWEPALAGVPAQVWLYKTMVDAGTFEYFMAVGDDTGLPLEQRPAVVNVTFSRFPITETRLHHSPEARPTLETRLDIGGHPFHVFNNHWKSGASNERLEPVRVGNAQVMRDRLDELLKADPHADILIGGDFNSHYNQSARFPGLKATGLNTILGSQGDEHALRQRGGPALYNLWYELPWEKRGSDVFRGQWGTLMQLIISRGLYDFRGIQYVDNSFGLGVISGKNADAVTGHPIRWTFAGNGGGYSDHFPLYAWFQTVPDNDPNRWMPLTGPRHNPQELPTPRAVDYAGADFSLAPDAAKIARGRKLQEAPDLFGRTFRVRATVSGEFPFRIRIGQEEFGLWAREEDFRRRIYQAHSVGETIEFFGQLGQHRGDWQFVVPHESWIKLPAVAGARR